MILAQRRIFKLYYEIRKADDNEWCTTGKNSKTIHIFGITKIIGERDWTTYALIVGRYMLQFGFLK